MADTLANTAWLKHLGMKPDSVADRNRTTALLRRQSRLIERQAELTSAFEKQLKGTLPAAAVRTPLKSAQNK
jgi:hypothetical protein